MNVQKVLNNVPRKLVKRLKLEEGAVVIQPQKKIKNPNKKFPNQNQKSLLKKNKRPPKKFPRIMGMMNGSRSENDS